MKIAMDSSIFDLYERMLDPNNRQLKKLPSGTRYSSIEQEAFDIIDALENIHKSGAIFCRLPSNKVVLNLPECCIKGFDIHKINKRTDELNGPYEDLREECKLLAEAEQCGVSIILTRNGNFIKLTGKSDSVKIIKPIDYFKK